MSPLQPKMTLVVYWMLINAAKLDLGTGLGVFTLNSTLTDLAEPSESLLATTVFQVGLKQVNHLLSSLQLERFRSGMSITPEDRCARSPRSLFHPCENPH